MACTCTGLSLQYRTILTFFFHNSLCPPGYILGCLQPQHASFIAPYWNNVTGLNATKLMEAMIKMFPSSAVYLAASPANPVAWIIYYLHGHLGHWFTVEEHRRKGLGTLVAEDLCKKLLCEEITPACLSGNEVAIAALKAIGFIENSPYTCNFLLNTGNSA